MEKKHDKLIGKIALKKELITQDQYEECWQFRTEQEPLIDILVSRGYLSRYQREELLREFEKIVAEQAQKETMSTCRNCGEEFNPKLLEMGKKLKCGSCGHPLQLDPDSGTRKAKSFQSESLDKTIERKAPALFNTMKREKYKYQIPGYKVLETLGESQTGPTYKAVWLKDESKVVVLKILNKKILTDKQAMQTFATLVKKSATLKNQPFKRNHAIEFHKDFAYIISEYVEGENLAHIVERGANISIKKAIKIIYNISKILKEARELDIIHGNITPKDILISKDAQIVLSNLGTPQTPVENILQEVESKGRAPLYIAPECVAEGDEVDYRSDIYSLGAVFYYLVAKKPPFEGTSPFEILTRLADDTLQLPPLQMYNSEVTPQISRIVEKMLAPEPENRFLGYDDLILHLQDPNRIMQSEEKEAEPEEKIDVPSPAAVEKKLPAYEKLATTDVRQKLAVPARTKETRKPDAAEEKRNRERMARKKQLPFVKLAFWGVLGLIIFLIVYNNYQGNAHKEEARQAYFNLRKEYRKDRHKPRHWNSLERKLQQYKKDYPEEKLLHKSVDKHLKELEKLKNTIYNGIIGKAQSQIDKYISDDYLMAALEAIDGFSEQYKTAKIEEELEKKRALVWQKARGDYEQSKQNFQALTKTYKDFFENTSQPISSEKLEKEKETLKLLERIAEKFPQESKNNSGELASYVTDAKNYKATLEAYQVKYKEMMLEIQAKKTRAAILKAYEKIHNFRHKFDYVNAIQVCDQALQDHDLVPEGRKRLEKTRETLNYLQTAKQHLCKYFKVAKSFKIKVVSQNSVLSLLSLQDKSIVLSKKRVISWDKLPQATLSKLIQIISTDKKSKILVPLSFMAQENKDYALAYRLLKAEVNKKNTAAVGYMDELNQLLEKHIKLALGKIQKSFEASNLNDTIQIVIQARNRYLIAPELSRKYSLKADDYFRKAVERVMNLDGVLPVAFKYFDFELRSHLKNWRSSGVPFKIKDESLLLYRGRVSVPVKNVQGISALCRFQTMDDNIQIKFGPYTLKIDGKGKFTKIADRNLKNTNVELGENQWFLLQLYIHKDKVTWKFNNKEYFTSAHLPKFPRTQLQFSVRSQKGIYIDNLVIGFTQ